MVNQDVVEKRIGTSCLVLCVSEITVHLQNDSESLESERMWLITAVHTETIL